MSLHSILSRDRVYKCNELLLGHLCLCIHFSSFVCSPLSIQMRRTADKRFGANVGTAVSNLYSSTESEINKIQTFI